MPSGARVLPVSYWLRHLPRLACCSTLVFPPACRAPSRPHEDDEEWFDQVRLVCTAQRTRLDEQDLCALVRWCAPTREGLLMGTTRGRHSHRMTCLQWAVREPQYSSISTNAILRPVTLQPYPTDRDVFVHNHFFSPTS